MAAAGGAAGVAVTLGAAQGATGVAVGEGVAAGAASAGGSGRTTGAGAAVAAEGGRGVARLEPGRGGENDGRGGTNDGRGTVAPVGFVALGLDSCGFSAGFSFSAISGYRC